MKLIKGLNGFLAATVALMMAATSCTNNLNEFNGGKPAPSPMNGSVVRTPDAIVWSGNQVFGDSFTGTRSEGVTHDVYTSSYSSNKGVKTRADEGNYFTVEPVTDEWRDTYERNGDKGPQNIVNFLKWGIDSWMDLDKETWVKEEWIKQRNSHDSYGEVKVPAYFPEGTTGDAATDLLNCDFAIKATAGYSITFYPYLTGQTDQLHKTIGLFYYDSEGEIHKEIIWDSEVSGYKDGKMEGVKVTANKDCTFGLYFSGRTQDSQVDDTVYYSLYNLNEDKKFHAGLIPENAIKEIFDGTIIMVEDWTDFDYDDFMIFVVAEKIDIVDDDELTNPDPSTKTPCPNCGHYGHTEEIENCPDCKDYGPAEGAHGSCWKDPNDDDDDDVCDHCGHKGHDHAIENCPDCKDHGPADDAEGSCWKDPSTGGGNEGSDDPVETPVGNEVEINLSILDVHTLPNGENKYDIDDLVSKLSMHVRYPHDIEVILPVPQSIYCDQDDLYILKTHDVDEYKYGGENHRLEYIIGGYEMDNNGKIDKSKLQSWTVTLGVDYVAAAEDQLTDSNKEYTSENGVKFKSGGYIRVYTEGICPELIEFLKAYYGDGINFEVYNYYNRGNNYKTAKYAEISYEFLQYHFLSHAFVNFDWNWNQSGRETKDENGTTIQVLPDNYINAFHQVNLLPTKGDCYTWIIGDRHANIDNVYLPSGTIAGSNTSVTWNNTNTERESYVDPYQGEHFNGSKFNWIYTLRSIGGADSRDMTGAPDTNWPFNDGSTYWQSYKFGDRYDWSWNPETGSGSTSGGSTGSDSTPETGSGSDNNQ